MGRPDPTAAHDRAPIRAAAAGRGRTDHDRTDHDRTGQDGADHDRADHDRADHDRAGLVVAVDQARRDLADGRRDNAEAVLRRHLTRIDPRSAVVDPTLIDAACLYAEVVPDKPDVRLRWAAFAFGASRRRYGAHHLRTLSAARILVQSARPGDRRPPGDAYHDHIADGTSILRSYLIQLVSSGRTADAHGLVAGGPRAVAGPPEFVRLDPEDTIR
jgi:hypothetical protein